MLTLRTASLTFLGLLTGFVAAAQSATPNDAPSSTTVLTWVVWWAAGVVLLMAIMTAGSVTSAAKYRYEGQQAESAAVETPETPETPAAAMPTATSSQAAPAEMAPVKVATQEEVFA